MKAYEFDENDDSSRLRKKLINCYNKLYYKLTEEYVDIHPEEDVTAIGLTIFYIKKIFLSKLYLLYSLVMWFIKFLIVFVIPIPNVVKVFIYGVIKVFQKFVLIFLGTRKKK